MDIIYGTVRFIQRDDESFMPWAKDSYACIIFRKSSPVISLEEGIEKAKRDFQALYDIALGLTGDIT